MKQVVLIMTDTQRKDMLGCYGNRDMITPNIDRLASGGVRFERAYTAQPVCGPARSCLFTGLYPHSNGSWGNGMRLYDKVKHIGQLLGGAQIPAGYIGKWHLDGGDYFGYGICPDGFVKEYWYDMRNYLEELSDHDREMSRRTESIYDPGVGAEFTYGYRCASRAVNFIQEYAERDFFLTLSFDEPHGPSLCPKEYADLYRDYAFQSDNQFVSLEGKPEHQKIWSARGNVVPHEVKSPAFFGCNTFIDAQIGRVTEKIRALCPDALVIYTSDHGDMLCSHSLFSKGPAMYDEITNIPLILAGGGLAGGEVCELPVSHIDVVPTVLDYFGLQKTKAMTGESLLKKSRSAEKRRNVFMEFSRYEIDHDGFMGFQPIRACFDGRYKLVINLLGEDELYDLKSERGETKNLIGVQAYLGIARELLEKIVAMMNDTRDPFRGYCWEQRAWNTGFAATYDYTGMTRQAEEEDMPRQFDYDTGLAMREAVRKK